LGESPPANLSVLLNFAIGAFIRVVKLLEKIHSLGILHADIHQGNIGFKTREIKCDFAHPENLVLIDFGLAEFFPLDMAKPELVGAGSHAIFNPVLISQFELAGYRRGRRDDIYRAFQDMVSTLSFHKLMKMYDLIMKKIKPNHDFFSLIKSKLQWTSDARDDTRFDSLFPQLPPLLYREIADTVNSYSGISEVRSVFGENWEQAKLIFKSLEKYVKNVDPDRPLSSPNSEPHYDWIIAQASSLLKLIK